MSRFMPDDCKGVMMLQNTLNRLFETRSAASVTDDGDRGHRIWQDPSFEMFGGFRLFCVDNLPPALFQNSPNCVYNH